jgi:hypothetical protein
MIATLLLAACGDKDDTGSADGPMGEIVAARAGESATVENGSVYAFNSASNGKLVLYLGANAGLSCEDVGVALDGPEEPDWDRAAFLPPETCSVFAYVDFDAAGVTWSAADSVAATLSVSCAMDPGSWEQSEDCLGSYCYTGHYWQGNPTTFQFGASGGDGEDVEWSVDMDGYDGQFTYESLEAAPASGHVAGSGTATWCPDIGQSSWFQQ